VELSLSFDKTEIGDSDEELWYIWLNK